MDPKKRAAEAAVEYIAEGMIVGLGTGSTACWAIRRIAEKVREGFQIQAAASSIHSEELAQELGIPLVPLSQINYLDITIDGADEVDSQLNLIKGGGGALLREKILAYYSKQFIVIVDESKLVQRLGRFPLPVEITPFAANLTLSKLAELGSSPRLRRYEGKPFITDNGNWIADCSFDSIGDPAALSTYIHAVPGIVDHGLFLHEMVDMVVIGRQEDTVVLLTAEKKE
jgi:ribose 5-phosphate isomerase A